MNTTNQKRREQKQQEWANRYALLVGERELAAWANFEYGDKAPVYIAKLEKPASGNLYTVPLWLFRPASYRVTEWRRKQDEFRRRVALLAAQTIGNPGSSINVFCK